MRLKMSALLLVLALAACEDSGVKAEKSEEDPNLPPAQVSLPDPPPESAYQIPEKHPDGTFRIEGLIHNRDQYLDKKVEVKGIIVKLSEPCDPGKAKKAGEECPEPNLFIRDTPESEQALRIVGYKPEFVKKAKLEEGQEHVFKGTYQKVAQGFVATEDGLLLVDFVDDIAVVEPQ